jgi:hypothetical protein
MYTVFNQVLQFCPASSVNVTAQTASSAERRIFLISGGATEIDDPVLLGLNDAWQAGVSFGI